MPNLIILYYFKHQIYLFFFLFSSQFLIYGQHAESHLNVDKKKLALSGYDLIEYYNHKAITGSSKFEATYDGARYLFSTQNNKLLFEKTPEKYTPQYGGWCAYAMGNSGEKIAINPESFSVENGKLYLFYKTFFNDTKAKWLKNTVSLKKEADENWNNLLNTTNHEDKN